MIILFLVENLKDFYNYKMENILKAVNGITTQAQRDQVLTPILLAISSSSPKILQQYQRQVLKKMKQDSLGYQELFVAITTKKYSFPNYMERQKERLKNLSTEIAYYQKIAMNQIFAYITIFGLITTWFSLSRDHVEMTAVYSPTKGPITIGDYSNASVTSINMKYHYESLPPTGSIAPAIFILFLFCVTVWGFACCCCNFCGWEGFVFRKLSQLKEEREVIEAYVM